MIENRFPGHELRHRREELGLSIYEVFRQTHVPTQYIEALEHSDLESLPGPCYASGFLKSYCVVLQLDPDRFIDTFKSCSRPAPARFVLRRNASAERTAPMWLNDLVSWAVVMGIIVLGWVTYTVVFSPHSDAGDNAVEAGVLLPEEQPPAKDKL